MVVVEAAKFVNHLFAHFAPLEYLIDTDVPGHWLARSVAPNAETPTGTVLPGLPRFHLPLHSSSKRV